MTEVTEFKPQPGPQSAFYNCEADICIYGGAAGGGKAVDPLTPVVTPGGMVPIKDLTIGSRVMNPDGAACQVTGVFHNRDVPMYLVTFEDGTQIKACKDHQWVAWHRHRKLGRTAELEGCDLIPEDPYSLVHTGGKVLNTRELAKWVELGYCPQVPVTRPLLLSTTYKEYTLSINAYAAGFIHLRPVMEPLRMWKFAKSIDVKYRVEGAAANQYARDLKLMNIPVKDRRIPDQILYGTLENRLLFAQGIFDKFGRPAPSKGRVYLTMPEDGPVVQDIMYLLRSLGCVCSYANIKDSFQLKIAISPFINPFPFNSTQDRKFKKSPTALGKHVRSIKYIGVGEAICISVDHPNKLYMVENFTVTHNTYGLLLEPLKWLDVPNFKTIILRRNRTEMTQAGGIWDESKEIYPYFKGKPIEGKLLWKFPNKNTVQLLDLEHESTLEKRKGAQVPLMMFDELSSFTERMFWYMLSRNRSATGVAAYVRATTNPVSGNDKNGGWVRHLIDWWLDDRGYPIPDRSGVIRYFVRFNNKIFWADDPMELINRFAPTYGAENVIPKSFTFIPATLDDNKLMDPTYRSNILAQGRVDKEQLLDGCWDVKVDSGTFFKRDWVSLYDFIEEPVAWLRYWDRAATEPNEENPDPDYTAGVLIGRGKKTNLIYIEDVRRCRKGPFEVQEFIKDVSKEDYRVYGHKKIIIEEDPGSAGKVEARALAHQLSAYECLIRGTGGKDKLTRFKPFSAAAQRGQIRVRKALWNSDYFDELEEFIGNGKGKDDQVDGTSGGYAEFINPAMELGKISLPNFQINSILGRR